MLELYIFTLIIGGGMLAFSAFSGGDFGSDADVDANIDSHVDIDSDTHLEIDSHVDCDNPLDAPHAAIEHIPHSIESINHSIAPANQSGIDGIKLLSLRSLTYFSAFFGLTGTVMTWIGSAFITTLLSAIFSGSVAAFFGYKLMAYLKSSESGQALNTTSFIGRKAKVIIPITPNKMGKILVEISGQNVELIAKITSPDTDSFAPGDAVLIVSFSDNVAIVSKYDI